MGRDFYLISKRQDRNMKFPFLSFCLSAVCVLLYSAIGAMPDHIMWHAQDGQRVWQWLSGHFVHISSQHLVWNIAALFILGSIIEQTSRRLLVAALMFGLIGVNLYLFLLFDLAAYAGLSGVLNSVLVIALYCLYQHPDFRAASLITLVLSLAKILVELSINHSLFSNLPWPPVPQAHLAGLIAGLVLVSILEVRKRQLLNSELVNFD